MKQTKMNKLAYATAFVLMGALGSNMAGAAPIDHHGKGHGHLTSAMKNPSRLEAHVVRDGDRKPAVVLACAG